MKHAFKTFFDEIEFANLNIWSPTHLNVIWRNMNRINYHYRLTFGANTFCLSDIMPCDVFTHLTFCTSDIFAYISKELETYFGKILLVFRHNLYSRDWFKKKWDWVFQTLWQYYLRLCWYVYICLIIRLWEFQNGKMGLSSLKIDRDTAKNVKIQILKNDSFC